MNGNTMVMKLVGSINSARDNIISRVTSITSGETSKIYNYITTANNNINNNISDSASSTNSFVDTSLKQYLNIGSATYIAGSNSSIVISNINKSCTESTSTILGTFTASFNGTVRLTATIFGKGSSASNDCYLYSSLLSTPANYSTLDKNNVAKKVVDIVDVEYNPTSKDYSVDFSVTKGQTYYIHLAAYSRFTLPVCKKSIISYNLSTMGKINTISNIQRGVITPDSTTMTINISTINPNKSLVILNSSLASDETDTVFTAFLKSLTATTLTIGTNYYSTSSDSFKYGGCQVSYQIIEFN